ncbi:hypothetical protein MTO96_046316 [Rhipicephalus appendiculatus]
MSTSVLEELFVHVQRVPAQDLERLDDESVGWLPRIRILRPEMAVQEIRRALEISPNVTEFLLRVAWLYCWLISRQNICPWLLIRFDASMLQVDFHELIRALGNALQSSPRLHTTLRVRHDRGTYYACLMNNYADPTSRECRAMFLVPVARPAIRSCVRGDERGVANPHDRLPRRPGRGKSGTAAGPSPTLGRRFLGGSPRCRRHIFISIGQ